MFGSSLPSALGWLLATKVYSGTGADIVMESITLVDPGQTKEGVLSVIAIFRQLTKRDQVADFVDLKGLTAEKILLVPNQKEFHLSSTAARCRLLSRRFMTFPAFSGFTPTCSRAARKCFRNRSKCTSFRPLSLDRAWAS